MRVALVLASLFLCAGAAAQEFDVFDLNDFVDPRIRGAEYNDNGDLLAPGDDVQIVRAAAGVVRNYQWRNTQTSEDARFFHLTHGFYRGRHQVNGKVTVLDGKGESPLPRYRGTAQWATYIVTRVKLAGDEDATQVAGRFLVSASIEENRYKDRERRRTRDHNFELGVQTDVAVPLPRGRSVTGSLVFMTRDMGEMGRAQRLTYFYRLDDRTFLNRFRLGTTIGVGGERTDAWHWGATRLGLTGAIDIPGIGTTLNVAWTPTYIPGARDRHMFHEVAVFLDRTLFTSLRPRK
jgi:hypothetical protein